MDQPNREEEITRLMREGVHPETFKDRMKLAGDKFMGNVPMGVDASSKPARKIIGSAAELLSVLKFGLLGGMSALFGVAFLYVGFIGSFDLKAAGVGAVMLVIGVVALRACSRAWRNFRAISRA